MSLLKNKKILVTKSRSDSFNSFQKLIDSGADIIYLPTIKITPLEITDEFKNILTEQNIFDYIIFTSPAAVKIFFELASQFKFNLNKSKIVVVGKRTAEECISRGINVAIIPDVYSSIGLITILSKENITNKKILIPCSKLSNDELQNSLTNLGANVNNFIVYDVLVNDISKYPEEYQAVLNNRPDIFIFTSPSSFKNYLILFNVNLVKEYFEKSVICAMGKTTAKEINRLGLEVNITPKISDLKNIADEIIDYCKKDGVVVK